MNGGPLQLRPVQPGDCRQLWEWANDPETRAASFQSQPIPWDEHCQWFEARIADPDCIWFVAQAANGALAGVARFQREPAPGAWALSLVVAPQSRGQGLARPLIELACEALARQTGQSVTVIARIRPQNERSRRAFEAAGFASTSSGAEALQLERRIPGSDLTCD